MGGMFKGMRRRRRYPSWNIFRQGLKSVTAKCQYYGTLYIAKPISRHTAFFIMLSGIPCANCSIIVFSQPILPCL